MCAEVAIEELARLNEQRPLAKHLIIGTLGTETDQHASKKTRWEFDDRRRVTSGGLCRGQGSPPRRSVEVTDEVRPTGRHYEAT